MADFGSRFINLFDDPRLAAAGGSGIDLSGRLRAAIALPELRSGPATLYVSKPCRFAGAIEVPANFGVLIGPGAFVVLASDAVLTIRGEVDLGIEPRFREEGSAEVRLLGPIDSIRPEWWGAGQPADSAMRSSVRCAMARADAGVAQVPIRLIGPYQLRETLVIGPRPHDAEVSISFEGAHPRGDLTLAPTLSQHPDAPMGAPLWRVEAGVVLSVTGVAFDLRLRQDDRVGIGGLEHAGITSALSYSRCTFIADRGVAVWVAARVDDGTRAEWHQGLLDRAMFSECWFQMSGTRDSGAIALKFADEGPFRARVDGCAFRGSASAMVALVSGMLEVVGCQFHNEAESGLTQDDHGAKSLSFWPGPDLLIGEFAQDPVEHRYPRPLAPLGLSVTHVQSRSPRFLCGQRGDDHDASADSFIVVTGLISRPEGADPTPPAVFWRGPVGGGIVLQGCDLRGACDATFSSDDETVVAMASRLRSPEAAGTRIRKVEL